MENRFRFQQGFRSEFGVFRGGVGGERGHGFGAAAAAGNTQDQDGRVLIEIF